MSGKALGAYQIAAALGIVAWWVYWFASGKYASAPLPDRLYENAFPPADLVFAGLLGVAGLAWWRAIPERYAVAGLVAGGMGLALAVVDTFHNVLVGAFHDATPATLAQKLVFAGVNASVGVLSVSVTWRLRGEVGIVERPLPVATRFVSVLAMIGLFAGVRDWVVDRGVDPDVLPFLRSLIAPSAVGAGLAALGGGEAYVPLLLAGSGVALHRWLLVLTSDLERGLFVDAIVAGALVAWAIAACAGARRLV